MPPEIAKRIAAGLELRRRGKLTPAQDAALSELQKRYSAAPVEETPNPIDNPAGDDGWRNVPPPTDTPPAESVAAAGFGDSGVGEEAGREWGAPREAGRESLRYGAIGAGIQGAGSTAFGVGTPLAAADEYARSHIGGKPRTWEESMEFARGQKEGLDEAYPAEYAAGNVLGLIGGAKATATVLSKAPALVKSVFQLQSGQTKRNIGRMAVAGAATAGTTAGMQEGASAVPTAAVVGGVAGGVLGGAVQGVVGGARAVMARINPEHAAIRALSKRLKESKENLTQLYNDFVERTGRRPGLAEIVTEVEAGRVGQVGAQFSTAGTVLREAEETAANVRPRELQAVVERGGRTTTVPEQLAERGAVVREAESLRGRRSFGGRVTSPAAAQETRRDNVMDTVMDRIGEHRVHATEAIKDILERQDVQELMPPILRRRINDAIQNGMDFGSIDIPLRLWEKVRKYAGTKARTEPLYSEYRDRIRDYVGARVPEYGKALQEYGRRSAGAEATTAAEKAVGGSAREFEEMLRGVGASRHGASSMVSSQVGVRNWLAKQVHQRPRQILERLSRDTQLRTNLRTALSQDEVVRLESLGEQYGLRLNIIEGVKTGQKIVRGSDAATFRDAVRTVRETPGGAAGVAGGARGALAGKAGEDAGSAVGTAKALTEPGLQDRLVTAFGAPEAGRLGRAGEAFTRSARNLRAATPSMSQAQQEAQEAARKAYNVITGTVMATGTASGALKAHFVQRVTERLNLGEKAAQRMAEYATDPRRAEAVIRRLRQAGVSSAEILKWYQDAAVAAGITTGSALSGN